MSDSTRPPLRESAGARQVGTAQPPTTHRKQPLDTDPLQRERPRHKNHVHRTRQETAAHALHHIPVQPHVDTVARSRNRTWRYHRSQNAQLKNHMRLNQWSGTLHSTQHQKFFLLHKVPMQSRQKNMCILVWAGCTRDTIAAL